MVPLALEARDSDFDATFDFAEETRSPFSKLSILLELSKLEIAGFGLDPKEF